MTILYKLIDKLIDFLEWLKWWLAQHKPKKNDETR